MNMPTQPVDAFLTRYLVRDRSLLIHLPERRRVLSSAPRGGGLGHARSIINHQVPRHPLRGSGASSQRTWSDPARYLGDVARRLRAPQPCVGLMTAVPLENLVVLREQADDLWVEGFFTVGVTKAVRVGESIDSTPSADPQKPGTINVVLITNAALTVSAMVTAVQVATESKAAVLLANRIPSWTGRSEATGTGTDVVVVVNGNGPLIRYSGTHTRIGELIGKLVSHGIESGLIKARRWKRSR